MKIINVFKTHFDIGFTELSADVIERYSGKMLEDVIKTCDATYDRKEGQRYVWTMAAWPLLQSLKNCSKANLAAAERLIKNGQIVTHALPFTTHTELMTKSEINYCFNYAREFCDKYNLAYPIAAKMTDVPGHTIALVKPLAQHGVKFLHLGCNPACLFPDVPTLFWWQDREGNRVLTFYNNTYGSSIVPPKGWKYPVWLSMQQSNDNIGPQEADVLDKIIDATHKVLPQAEVSFGRLEDFYNEIIKCDLSDLPVVKGDIGDTWIHGVGTYPEIMGDFRRARDKVEALDLPFAETEKFYENAILFCEHTWGLDVKTHLTAARSFEKQEFIKERELPRYKLMEKSWKEQRDRALYCINFAKKFADKPEKVTESCLESDKWKIEISGGALVIFDKTNKVNIKPQYKYEIIGTQKMNDFLRYYVTRFCDWVIADVGRQSYGEVDNAEFAGKLKNSFVSGGKLVCEYETDKESYDLYGNCKKVVITSAIEGEEVKVKVELLQKQASPFIEGGNMFFNTDIKSGKYMVKKIDYLLDCEKDIVKNANTKLFCVSDLAQIGSLAINPIDSPLVSFGESAIFQFNGGEFTKPKENNLVFNLFNNMWGTNFPQWTEGNFTYEYILKQK